MVTKFTKEVTENFLESVAEHGRLGKDPHVVTPANLWHLMGSSIAGEHANADGDLMVGQKISVDKHQIDAVDKEAAKPVAFGNAVVNFFTTNLQHLDFPSKGTLLATLLTSRFGCFAKLNEGKKGKSGVRGKWGNPSRATLTLTPPRTQLVSKSRKHHVNQFNKNPALHILKVVAPCQKRTLLLMLSRAEAKPSWMMVMTLNPASFRVHACNFEEPFADG